MNAHRIFWSAVAFFAAFVVFPCGRTLAGADGTVTQAIGGVRYVCEDGVCRLVDDAAEVVSAEPLATDDAGGVPASGRPTRILCGYRSAREIVAFLDGRPVEDPLVGRGFLVALLFALLGGLAMNLTPCVLPMVPVMVIVIGRSVSRGLLYALGIVLAYGALGVAAALGGSAFGTIQSHPVFNLAVAVLFVILSLALSGAFAIDLTRYRRGLHGGAFLMGALTALLAGACVAPVLASVLLLTAKLHAEGNVGAFALPFAVGVGLALPWPFLGAGLKVLPKPGAWMRWVNRAFALAVLALAAHYAHLAWTAWRGTAVASSEMDAAAFARRGVDGLKRPVLVDCGASWCGNCAALERLLRDDPSIRTALGRYTLLRVRAEDLGVLRRASGFESVPGLPVLAVYDK